MAEIRDTDDYIREESGLKWAIHERRLSLAESLKLYREIESRTRTHDVQLGIPQIQGVDVKAFSQLKHIVSRNFPWILDHERIDNLLKSAQIHFQLSRIYEGRAEVTSREIAYLAEKTEHSTYTIRSWLCKSTLPRIYYILEKYHSASESSLDELKLKLNDVTCMTELLRRFTNLYKGNELLTNPKLVKHAERFFDFLAEIESGYPGIAKRLGVTRSEYQRMWRQYPHLVNLAICCPKDEPDEGKKWLSLKTNGHRMEEFIQVPLTIDSPDDILEVLSQLTPRIPKELEEFEKENGKMDQHLAFLYLLGIISSDGSFDTYLKSTRLRLKLSKKYEWSEDVGMGFRYALGLLGFESWRGKDTEKTNENGETQHYSQWRSVSSPFFHWIEDVLGLTTSRSLEPSQADWILEMPQDWRIAYLQGLSDGDGYASLRAQCVGISTDSDQVHIGRLLSSLGINPYFSPKGVHFSNKASIRLADELPMFRYAHGRQFRLSQLVLMREHRTRKHLLPREIQLIHRYSKQGLTTGEIGERLWTEHGISRCRSTILRTLKREDNGGA